ncbi:hypothetical protein K0B96_09055 [Horticoccus luteus]|uniref:Tetratricopeptide repeat protein n=1 Tax=Horticoccus luteus TaxID=2862869 RepID=A0A8F9TSU9_9BACT|nr:hypothetical protein [Horticoccus luteus]QYM77480.1 hypothetical protein K0B96_09055 [Horticoccus luteus]
MSRKSSRQKREFKMVWASARAVPGRWYLGVVGLHDPDAHGRFRGVALSVRGILAWLGVLAVLAYLALALALFLWLDRRPFNMVTFSDIALPTRWSRISDLRGKGYIEEGMADLKNGRWMQGEMKLRVGLSKHPDNLRARMTLGQFYLAIGRRVLALNVLQAGLQGTYPGRIYLNAMLQVASQCEDFPLALRVIDETLARPAREVPESDRRWLRGQKMQLLVAAHRAPELLEMLDAMPDLRGPEADEARVLALVDAGRLPEAESFLAQWLARAPKTEVAQVMRLQVRIFREQKKMTAMNDTLDRLRALAPADPRTTIYAVVQQTMAGETTRAAQSMDEFVLRFGSDLNNLITLAQPLAEIGAVPLLQRCLAEAQAQGLPTRAFYAAETRAFLHTGQFREAAQAYANFKRDTKEAARAEEMWVSWMDKLLPALIGPPESAQVVELQAFLRSRPFPVSIYRETEEILRKAGRLDTAREVLAMGIGAFPASAALATSKAEVDEQLAAARPAESEKAAAPGPAAGPRERVVFEDLDRLIGEGKWSEAAEQARAVLLSKPAWLPKRESELLRIEMRGHFENGATAEMIGAARMLMDGSNARAQQVVDFAAEVSARGQKDTAATLLGEVLRKTPDYPPAKRALKELEEKPKVHAKG